MIKSLELGQVKRAEEDNGVFLSKYISKYNKCKQIK